MNAHDLPDWVAVFRTLRKSSLGCPNELGDGKPVVSRINFLLEKLNYYVMVGQVTKDFPRSVIAPLGLLALCATMRSTGTK